MPDTGEKRGITRFVNAKEAETILYSIKVASKAKAQSGKVAQEYRPRKEHKGSPPTGPARPGKITEARQDREASERMADEGGPNPKP